MDKAPGRSHPDHGSGRRSQRPAERECGWETPGNESGSPATACGVRRAEVREVQGVQRGVSGHGLVVTCSHTFSTFSHLPARCCVRRQGLTGEAVGTGRESREGAPPGSVGDPETHGPWPRGNSAAGTVHVTQATLTEPENSR